MRLERGRTKKLIVAFHFQFSNPAAWKCEDCRKSRLEIKRRCGRLAKALETAPRVVWARKKVSTTECPRSLISGQSLAWLEEFHACKRLGYPDVRTLTAREGHAMLILEQEYSVEVSGGQD